MLYHTVIFSSEITIHTAIYGANIRFWPTLAIQLRREYANFIQLPDIQLWRENNNQQRIHNLYRYGGEIQPQLSAFSVRTTSRLLLLKGNKKEGGRSATL